MLRSEDVNLSVGFTAVHETSEVDNDPHYLQNIDALCGIKATAVDTRASMSLGNHRYVELASAM